MSCDFLCVHRHDQKNFLNVRKLEQDLESDSDASNEDANDPR